MDAAAAVSGPDFLCIGLQKSGTRWLYQQLEAHPEFWMPPIKELHFFDKPFHRDRKIEVATTKLAKGPEVAEFLQLLKSLVPKREPDFRLTRPFFLLRADD